jgi:hypothetical protein
MKIWSRFVIALVIAAGVGILRVPILQAVTAAYQETVRIVDSTGNVINGTASAVSANYQKTVRVVDSNGHVLDAFGGSSSTGYTANGGVASVGSIAISPVTVPAAPSIVSGFTGGTTDYYYCAAGDINVNPANGLGLTPLSSPTGTTATTGTMSCPGETGALKLYLLRYTANTVPTGAQSVLVASCSVTSGTGCNLSDAANSPTSFFVQGTQGNGTNYLAAGSGIFSPALALQDGIDIFMPSGTAGNPLVNYSNGTVVSAINSKGQFFSQPTDTNTIPFVGNAPSGTTASLLDLLVNNSHKFTVTSNGALLVGSLTSSVTGNPSIGMGNFTGTPGFRGFCVSTGVSAVTANTLLTASMIATSPFTINNGMYFKLGTGDGSNNSDIGFYYCGATGTGTCNLIDDIGAQHISSTSNQSVAYTTNAACTGSLAPGGLCTGVGTGTYPTLPATEPPGYYVWAATSVAGTATFQFCNNAQADIGWFARSTAYSSSSGGTLPATISAPSFAITANNSAFGMVY